MNKLLLTVAAAVVLAGCGVSPTAPIVAPAQTMAAQDVGQMREIDTIRVEWGNKWFAKAKAAGKSSVDEYLKSNLIQGGIFKLESEKMHRTALTAYRKIYADLVAPQQSTYKNLVAKLRLERSMKNGSAYVPDHKMDPCYAPFAKAIRVLDQETLSELDARLAKEPPSVIDKGRAKVAIAKDKFVDFLNSQSI